MCVNMSVGAHRDQEGLWDPLELQVIIRCLNGCWELNVDPMKEQSVFLTTQCLSSPPALSYFCLCLSLKINEQILYMKLENRDVGIWKPSGYL